MGTRGLTLVICDGQTKVAQYGQFDHYPSGQGVNALEFMRDIISRGEMEKFRERIREMKWLDEETEILINNNPEILDRCPWVSRGYGAKILRMIHDGTYRITNFPNPDIIKSTHVEWLVNSEGFLKDSLFCEGCIVIDLDSNVFEWHNGFNQTPLTEGRFKDVEPNKEDDGSIRYYPVRFVASFSLYDLPTNQDFIRICS
jgi:hypothetical protein